MGETAWSGSAYRRLLRLLPDPVAGKLLRHADAIDGAAVGRLDMLPAPMSVSYGLALALSNDAACAVSEAFAAITATQGLEAAEAAARRWSGCATPDALFDAVREDLYPEPPAPPFAETPRLRPLATKADLRDAARRYANCLATRVNHAVGGWSAYYEWTEGQGAIVEVGRDAIFGWRLNEAKGPGNAVLDADVREDLIDDLALMGVYVGRSGWQLERALNTDAGRGWRLSTVAEDLAEVFGD
jgi:hypothetical protein